MLHHPDAIARHAHAAHDRLLCEAAEERAAQAAIERPSGERWSVRIWLAVTLRTLAAALRRAADRLEGRPHGSRAAAPH